MSVCIKQELGGFQGAGRVTGFQGRAISPVPYTKHCTDYQTKKKIQYVYDHNDNRYSAYPTKKRWHTCT